MVADMSESQLADIRNRMIGFVFQTFNLIPRSDIFHNVELPLIYGGVPKLRRRELAERAIERVGLTDRMKPSRVKNSLPDPIKALIVAESGKGYWLDLG